MSVYFITGGAVKFITVLRKIENATLNTAHLGRRSKSRLPFKCFEKLKVMKYRSKVLKVIDFEKPDKKSMVRPKDPL